MKKNISKHNLKHKQQIVIYELKNDDSIVIKEADKGGASIIMNRDYKKTLSEKHLNDIEYYENNRKAKNRNWSNQKPNPALKTKTGNK